MTTTRALLPLLAIVAAACASSRGEAPPAEMPDRVTHTITSVSGAGEMNTRTIVTHPGSGTTASSVDVAPDTAWSRLSTIYPSLGIAVATLDPAQRMIGNRQLQLSRTLGGVPLSRYVRCGENPFGVQYADSYRVQMSVTTVVRPRDTGSEVSTSVNATATAPGQGVTTDCTTTGALEAEIARRVASKG